MTEFEKLRQLLAEIGVEFFTIAERADKAYFGCAVDRDILDIPEGHSINLGYTVLYFGRFVLEISGDEQRSYTLRNNSPSEELK